MVVGLAGLERGLGETRRAMKTQRIGTGNQNLATDNDDGMELLPTYISLNFYYRTIGVNGLTFSSMHA